METIPEFLESVVSQYGQNIAYKWRDSEKQSTIHSKSFAELGKEVDELAIGLFGKMGVQKGDHVALIGNNSIEWILSDLALASAGMVSVPRNYETADGSQQTPDEMLHNIINHSDSKFAIVENEQAIRKIEPVAHLLKGIAVIDPKFDASASAIPNVISFKELQNFGKDNKGLTEVLEKIKKNVRGSDLASLMYTSGTTGNPKGVMILQNNFIHNIENIPKVVAVNEHDRVLSFLPFWHSYQREVNYIVLGIGASNFIGKTKLLRYDVKDAQPTLIPFIPEGWIKVYETLLEEIKHRKPIERALAPVLIAGAMEYGRAKRVLKNEEALFKELSPLESAVRKLSAGIKSVALKPVKAIADKKIFSALRDKMGGSLKWPLTGGGSIPYFIDSFMDAAGMRITEGYGATEFMVIGSARDIDHYTLGTIGAALPGIDIKILNEDGNPIKPGETGMLLIAGPNVFAGYYKNEEATRKVMQGGYFITNDLATKTIDSRIKIIGRADDTIVLSNGKKIEPGILENELKASHYIEHAAIYGTNKPYPVAVIAPKKIALEELAEQNHIEYKTLSELEENPVIKGYYRALVQDITRRKGSSNEVVKDIVIATEPLIVGEQLTESLKLNKKELYKTYAPRIEALYK